MQSASGYAALGEERSEKEMNVVSGGLDRRTTLLLHELLLGRSECLQMGYATETLDLIQEVIDHDPQALIFRRQLSDRAMQG